jgi:CRP-like cAMP-binding protein
MTLRRSFGVTLTSDHTLSSVGWFSEQSEEFRQRMLSIARWQKYRAGDDLYSVGDDANGIFGLEMGRIDVSIPISSEEMVTIHRARPGFWIGDSALLSGTQRGVSLVSHGESMVLIIPAKPLKILLDRHPQGYANFYRLAHSNTMLTLQVLAETIALPPRARFARLLLRLATQDGVVDATQSELGALAGMSRAAFRRAFAELIDDGVVKPEYGLVRILDEGRLTEEADKR